MILIDSNVIINLTYNCLLKDVIDFLKERNIYFYITPEIYNEIAKKGIYNNFISKNVLDCIYLLDEFKLIRLNKKEVNLANYLDNLINNIYITEFNIPLKILHKGELELLAVYLSRDFKVLLSDERILRLTIEDPYKLKELYEKRLETKIKIEKNKLEAWNKFVKRVNIFNSADLVSYLFISGFFKNKINKILKNSPFDKKFTIKRFIKSIFYSLKLNGCGISYGEVNSYAKYVKIKIKY